MTELIKVTYDNDRPVVSARELHDFLEVETPFNKWFPRMCEYGFTEGQDFWTFLSESTGGRPAQEAVLTIDMAKEVCMIQRSEKGKRARQYFIQIEKDWNSPEKVMARALDIAHRELNTLKAANAELTVQNSIMQPKADYFDELVDRNLLTSFRETAKLLHIKQNTFIRYLLDHKYLYRKQSGKLMVYQKHIDDGLFELKEQFNQKTEWKGTQPLVTPKGRETFRLLLEGTKKED